MKPDTCPVCNNPSLTGGGGTFGGSLNQSHYTCPNCDSFIEYLAHQSGRLLSVISKDACEQVGTNEHPSWEFPKSWGDWVNNVVLPAWRFRAFLIKKSKANSWAKWLAEVFYPKFPELKGRTHAEHPDYVLFTDTTISYPDCPPEAQALYDSRPEGAGVPKAMRTPVYPPQMPRVPGVTNYYWAGEWVLVDQAYSMSLEAPEDPILTSNREYFADVWAQLEAELGYAVPKRTEVENGYGGKEPWYQLDLNGTKFTVGWRKHVVSVQAAFPQAVPTAEIRALAVRDGTTYEAHSSQQPCSVEEQIAEWEADGQLKDEGQVAMMRRILNEKWPDGTVRKRKVGGWQSEMAMAEEVLIHAWKKETLVEYLVALFRSAASVPSLGESGEALLKGLFPKGRGNLSA